MLLPVRVVVGILVKNVGVESKWYYFYKDTELSPVIFYRKNTVVRLQTRICPESFMDFRIDSTKDPVIWENISHIIIHMISVTDENGSLIESFCTDWNMIEDTACAGDFQKNPVPKKIKKLCTKKKTKLTEQQKE
ncbi:MAG: hypothetical protein A3J54_01840 [Candidatus Ryanbacteria bacterium RIFCSPHIGHO2_02_FULL_45_13b]|uniref:Uncharacterized protein n=1 Tax=Candidatus Ryanbacteria bacterium RIFCSPHIGHO2_02_FULL_45_13b TaxID=1802117 RepID=A0A1G2G9Y2_9BACT|nr:MAG: hypothetical protein A3J54_01840 [Candidatus Ryanbacteria bacterium RIFCSPHIGHO2_02_FULL_45_13b]